MRRRQWCVLLLLATALRAETVRPKSTAVDAIGITVTDLDRSVAFYTQVLDFELLKQSEHAGDDWEHLQGLFGLRLRRARLRLGSEHIELTEYLVPHGRPVPRDSRSNDRWFQHIAIIVSDMDRAYAHLRRHRVRHASSGPQRLPDWNPNAGGIQAFYFLDPDGHPLEILRFPAGKGAPQWHAPNPQNRLFLGIDHTAIVISNTEDSLRFYRDQLGLTIAGESENHGTEQEHLNHVFGARLRITALRASTGPGIEFLEYLSPNNGRPYPRDSQSNDLWHWQTRILTDAAPAMAQRLRSNRTSWISSGLVVLPTGAQEFRQTFLVRDPDGHAIEIAGQ